MVRKREVDEKQEKEAMKVRHARGSSGCNGHFCLPPLLITLLVHSLLVTGSAPCHLDTLRQQSIELRQFIAPEKRTNKYSLKPELPRASHSCPPFHSFLVHDPYNRLASRVMVKKRAVAAMTTATPVFPFPAAADQTELPYHFSDYGFDPQLLCSSQLPETKRAAAWRHHQQQQPPPVEPARFKLQKPISKKHQHTQKHSEKQRRRWWRSAASAALLFFKRPSSRTAGAASSSSCSTAAFARPGQLYFADDGGDDSTGCTCWSPSVRSGHLTAAELGVASFAVPYVSLRDVNFGRGIGGVAPSMPIYLVT